jgi:putative membrane protein insertion efficiency factor|tara:strand:+ start:1641 stop:1850 length:210 start_codon:yes stop_codon:yes gene_type:complete
MKKISILLIKFYQQSISMYLPSACIYIPSCSQYAIETIEKYNIFKSLYLIIKRLIKCNPMSKKGYDPVQ